MAVEHVQPARITFSDEPRKLYLGRIPKGTPDSLIETLLKTCCENMPAAQGSGTTFKSWKRTVDGSGEPRAFGFAEFDSVEGVFSILKLLNNAAMTFNNSTSRLLVNTD